MTAARATILLVDDDPDDAELTKVAFRKAGFANPIVVCEGEDAMHYLAGDGQYADGEKFPLPQLVLLDRAMPGMTGWEILAWLRRCPELKSLPVIILSGSAFSGDKEKAKALGANAYEVKPQEFEQFVKLAAEIGDFWLRGA